MSLYTEQFVNASESSLGDDPWLTAPANVTRSVDTFCSINENSRITAEELYLDTVYDAVNQVPLDITKIQDIKFSVNLTLSGYYLNTWDLWVRLTPTGTEKKWTNLDQNSDGIITKNDTPAGWGLTDVLFEDLLDGTEVVRFRADQGTSGSSNTISIEDITLTIKYIGGSSILMGGTF